MPYLSHLSDTARVFAQRGLTVVRPTITGLLTDVGSLRRGAFGARRVPEPHRHNGAQDIVRLEAIDASWIASRATGSMPAGSPSQPSIALAPAATSADFRIATAPRANTVHTPIFLRLTGDSNRYGAVVG